jgi:hypothetical protein
VSRFFVKRRTAGLVAIMAACIAAASAYAFTTSNTGVAHTAGVATGTVTGYAVSAIGYTYSNDGVHVEKVTFTLDAHASDVAASLATTPDATHWVDCGAATAGNSDTVICDFTATTAPTGATNADATTGPTVAAATKLTVAAVGTGTITIH